MHQFTDPLTYDLAVEESAIIRANDIAESGWKVDQNNPYGENSYWISSKNNISDEDVIAKAMHKWLVSFFMYICLLYTSPSPRDS